MAPVQQYFLPGYGLSRHIVLGHIHYFLGPSATVRPYSYQGREGYLINGVPLTRDQIDDLMVMSREYERQEATRMVHNASAASASTTVNDTSNETYINEIIFLNLNQPARRRAEPDSSRGGR
ncbi:uncharacterized protein N7515_004460 [Penicillium bovifimosum]|uniref:Uncharacterized protein n=1 Tax=Penicillium bovifimosum TaxID=126998 RepID=A0A9W9L3X5_9EURO|nr:uncharacterized protein N7515_004460 [Penicillium bovifimosum]KAJ5135182.1 hypothetical protein N7515_004460 [Penicillium bovifimosum]